MTIDAGRGRTPGPTPRQRVVRALAIGLAATAVILAVVV